MSKLSPGAIGERYSFAQDCTSHTRRRADKLSLHWNPHRLRKCNSVGLRQGRPHGAMDTGAKSGCLTSITQSCICSIFHVVVNSKRASARTLAGRLRCPGLLPRSDLWIARRQHVVHPQLGAKLRKQSPAELVAMGQKESDEVKREKASTAVQVWAQSLRKNVSRAAVPKLGATGSRGQLLLEPSSSPLQACPTWQEACGSMRLFSWSQSSRARPYC